MNTKKLIFSTLFLINFNALIKSCEIGHEKELTKYEKVLIQFPGIEPDLVSKNISKEDIKNSEGFSVCGSMIYFEIGDQTISIKKDKKDLTKYKIKIQKTSRLMFL